MNNAKEYLRKVLQESPFTLEEISLISDVDIEKLKSLEGITASEFTRILSRQGISTVQYLDNIPVTVKFRREDLDLLNDRDLKCLGHILELAANLFNMEYLNKQEEGK